jgi:sugar O-acyltransferase (sialic acid O-acetyltransferase NeuD family)
MIIFGVQSPLVVEFEETCHRLAIEIAACVSVRGNARVLDHGKVVALDAFDRAPVKAPFIACAFAPRRREALVAMARERRLMPAPALIDPTAVLARSVRVGDGSFINAGTVVGALSIIGQNVLVNRAVSVGHHALIGDFVSIGPGATLAGNIHVGAGTLIGAGAVILPHIRIGSGAIVGAGSLVREHVPDGTFVAGNPARAILPMPASLEADEEE